MTLTYEHDLDRMNHNAKYLNHTSLPHTAFESYRPDNTKTHRHSRTTALLPLQCSVKI